MFPLEDLSEWPCLSTCLSLPTSPNLKPLRVRGPSSESMFVSTTPAWFRTRAGAPLQEEEEEGSQHALGAHYMGEHAPWMVWNPYKHPGSHIRFLPFWKWWNMQRGSKQLAQVNHVSEWQPHLSNQPPVPDTQVRALSHNPLVCLTPKPGVSALIGPCTLQQCWKY